MKKITKIVAVLLSVCAVFFVFYEKGGEEESGIPKISFPERAGGNDYKFEVSNNIDEDKIKEIEKDEEIEQYYVVNESVNESVIDNICKKFDVEKLKENRINGAITYGEKNKLRVDDNGSLEYYSLNKNDLRELTLNETECRQLADKIMNEIGVDMEEYKYFGTIQGTGYNVDTPEEKFVISKEVVYVRNLNNQEVYGDSKISICFTDEGTVQSISVNSRQIEEEEKTGEVRTVDDALESLEEFDGFIDVPDGTSKVVVEDVNIAYWEDTDITNENNTIQPVYEFTGIAYDGEKRIGTFTALEQILE